MLHGRRGARVLRSAWRRICTGSDVSGRYPHIERMSTRWNDNDAFGHVNNVMYYAYMDTAVNNHLISQGVTGPRYVVESSCRYLHPLKYPQPVEVGLRITKLGRSSACYAVGIFSLPAERTIAGSPTPPGRQLCAEGTFVHVYVDDAGKPAPMPESTRRALLPLTEQPDKQGQGPANADLA